MFAFTRIRTAEESHASRRLHIPHPVLADRIPVCVYWKPVPTSAVRRYHALQSIEDEKGGGLEIRRNILPLSRVLRYIFNCGTRDSISIFRVAHVSDSIGEKCGRRDAPINARAFSSSFLTLSSLSPPLPPRFLITHHVRANRRHCVHGSRRRRKSSWNVSKKINVHVNFSNSPESGTTILR